MEKSIILNGIKEAFEKGEATINLREASTLTSSGSGRSEEHTSELQSH